MANEGLALDGEAAYERNMRGVHDLVNLDWAFVDKGRVQMREVGACEIPGFVRADAVDAELHARLTWGAAQAGVAAGVAAALRKGVISSAEADDVVIVAAVWVNPEAHEEEAVYANNAQAMLAALTAGRDGAPTASAVLDGGEPTNPYFRS